MGYRSIDWQCDTCKATSNHLTWVGHGDERPRESIQHCDDCDAETSHHSVMGMPAMYLGERILNPKAYGGQCDTMGFKEFLPLPEMRGEKEHSAKIRDRMSTLSPEAPKGDRDMAFSKACTDAPTAADYAAHFSRPEYKEIEKKNEQIAKENAQKRARAAAWKKGEQVNFRRDKCAGDPDMTA